ncbi:MAG: hypothetical protein H6706_02910 [Myxococcales bacterium]|nr:hypothetical protein [Myxococcales bacterium]
MSPRARRFVGLALAVGIGVFAARSFQQASREISIRYEGPPGPLTVTLSDAEGTRLRRVDFAAGAPRQHALRLPDGPLDARLEQPGRPPVVRHLQVEGDGALLVRWP